MAKSAVVLTAPSLRIAMGDPLVAPSALSCLRCQLLGHRKLLCSKVDVCKEIPHVRALAPLAFFGLFAALLASLVVFILRV